MTLSVLICTIPSRLVMLERLTAELRSQVLACNSTGEVEVLADNGDGTIGAKRQWLLEKAQGDYVCFIDDDDEVSSEYISAILHATQSRPDVIGFKGYITTDGKKRKWFSISRHHQYRDRIGGYERYNNHLSPVLRSIALQIGYADKSWQEDYDYATRLHGSGLIQTEHFINKELYHYKYVSTKKSYC